jgi:hypothetical protein
MKQLTMGALLGIEQMLKARNVPPHDDGCYHAYVHPTPRSIGEFPSLEDL